MYIADIVVRAIACANSTIPQERRGKGGGRSAENKREMYGRKDLICSCRVCFRLGVGGGGKGWAKLIFISVQRGLEGGVNLHVSFATDPGYAGAITVRN